MASPSGSANGGIIGATNRTSYGKNKVTSKIAGTPSAATLGSGTRLIDTLVVAGGGAAGMDNSGGGGAGGVIRTQLPVSGCQVLGQLL